MSIWFIFLFFTVYFVSSMKLVPKLLSRHINFDHCLCDNDLNLPNTILTHGELTENLNWRHWNLHAQRVTLNILNQSICIHQLYMHNNVSNKSNFADVFWHDSNAFKFYFTIEWDKPKSSAFFFLIIGYSTFCWLFEGSSDFSSWQTGKCW